MKPVDLNELSSEVLTHAELFEDQLLSWGFIGGMFDAPAKIQEVLAEPPTRFIEQAIVGRDKAQLHKDILQNLLERKLLIHLSGNGYRTRYAETFRLLQLLKQRFKESDWFNAPNLVSSIKSNLQYRRFPMRTVTWETLSDQLEDESIVTSFMKDVLYQLLDCGEMKLSMFQVQSILELLKEASGKEERGAVIGAGTGSGKTKSFYLPAFAKVAETISQDIRHWTRVLGVYPRNELLKDQFREALSEIRKLNTIMKRETGRSILIGSYYGETPKNADEVRTNKYRKWEQAKDGSGYIVPFFTCPEPACSSPMVWKNEDIAYEHERLFCTKCSYELTSETIVLTRERMHSQPPDFLFTTTEMLNRKLASARENRVFGVHAVSPPLFVLLDEAHIYNGVSGAHVSYVLRRWKHLVKQKHPKHKAHFVGLSATLTNPQSFFAQLIGVSESSVTYITPTDEELIEKAMEYNLVLRGDPFSATSLLSTTVQTAMLLTRMLDPLHKDVSEGAWGSKVFGFTDKLDVINRWAHIEKDAEEKLRLARYRDSEQVASSYRTLFPKWDALGQLWGFARQIDQDAMRRPLKVSITSSQQKGVDEKAKLVIATSTLEVGYNDPKVGAVIQHKSPRGLASFLQRKGRAGRRTEMRPWTVVVTSAYGRDRFVFDYPELLFAPNLPELHLPIRNSYVQRIQLSFCLMDWLTEKLRTEGYTVNAWEILSPSEFFKHRFTTERHRVQKIVEDLLSRGDEEFQQFASDALQVDPTSLTQLCWLPPRSLYFDVLPTLRNQLISDFYRKAPREEWGIRAGTDKPLEGYIPQNLFSALDSSEITLELPYPVDGTPKTEYLSLTQAMIEFAPGNVSKRYVRIDKTSDAHWLEIPANSDPIEVQQENIKSELLTTIETGGESFSVFQPYKYVLKQIPPDIVDRTSGYLEWKVDIHPISLQGGEAKGKGVVFPQSSTIGKLFEEVRYYLSTQSEASVVTRFAPHAHVEVKKNNGEVSKRSFSFSAREEKAALGFQIMADAIAFTLHDIEMERIFTSGSWEAIRREVIVEYYVHRLQKDDNIKGTLNVFEINWLAQICISALMGIAISRDCSLDQAIREFMDKRYEIAYRTLETIFRSTVASQPVTQFELNDSEEGKVYKKLLGYLQQDKMMAVLTQHLEVFSSDLHDAPDFSQWLKRRLCTTVAASIMKALTEMLPEVNMDDLQLDIVGDTIWISESESGGIGMITRISSLLSQSPVLFEELFIHAIKDCDRDRIAHSLDTVLEYEDELTELFTSIRREKQLETQKSHLEKLQRELDKRGITPRRETIVTLANKMLSPVHSDKTQALVKDLRHLWKEEESRLGIRVDLSVFSVACIRRADFRKRANDILQGMNPRAETDDKQIFSLVESLLWQDCKDSCPECLAIYSQYHTFLKPSRILLEAIVDTPHVTVEFGSSDWREQVLLALRESRPVQLLVEIADIALCKQELLVFIHEPIEFEYEIFYPYVAWTKNEGSRWRFELRIREVPYA